MVILNSSTDMSTRFPSSSSSSPISLHLWKRFKKEKSEDSQKFEKDEEKPLRKPENKIRQNRAKSNRTSSSFLDNKTLIINRSVMQEKMMASQSQSKRQNQSHESSFSTDSSFDSSTHRQRRYLSSDDYYNKENEDCVNMIGVLHLKKPLSANSDNAKRYYEDRGRMEPINWKNDPRNIICQEKKPEIKKKPEMPKKTIKTIAISKPQVSDEFSNFVMNSVSRADAYNTQGNIERNVNAINCPLIKIQQLINRKPLETIQIPASVRKSFLDIHKPDSHLFNRIDTFKVIDPKEKTNPRFIEAAKQDDAHVSKHTAVPNENSHYIRYKDVPKENERFVNAIKCTDRNDEGNQVPEQGSKSFSNDVKVRTTDHANQQSTNSSQQTNGFDNHVKYPQNRRFGYKNQSKEENGYLNNAGPMQNGYSQRKFKEDVRSYRIKRLAQNGSSDCKNDLKENMQFSSNVKFTEDKKFQCVQIEKEDTHNLTQNKMYKSEVKISKETKDQHSTHDCDDYDMVSYVNSLSYQENVAKRESRKQAMDVEDDLFAFVQNPLESNSGMSNSPAPSARKISSYNYPFDRIKAVCKEKEKANTTLDSDDTFNISSDVESLSVSIVSTRDRFRAFKKKILERACKQNESCSILPDENDDRKVLENKNQLLNRCLRASHDYLKIHKNNIVEITNVKVGPKPEPLLKPISTRYFLKPSTNTEKLSKNDSNNELEKAEHFTPSVSEYSNSTLLNSTPMKNSLEETTEEYNVDICIKSNASIDNISSIATSSVGVVDSKTEFKSESNHKILFDEKNREIDSGLCIKSNENSLVTPGMSGTKFDSDLDNGKNCDVSMDGGFTGTTNISENFKSTIQSENQHSTKSSAITKMFDTKSEVIENECKFDVISSDSESEMMDSAITKMLDTKSEVIENECKFDVISSDSESEMMDCEDVIDFDAFEIENLEMWFPSLSGQVESIKKAFSEGMTNDSGMLSLAENPNNSKIQSLESDFESSHNNHSSANASLSSNLNSDSDNPSSPCSLFNLDSVFEKVDIEFSELKMSGLDYDDNQTKEIEFTNQTVSKKIKGVHLDLYPINSKENTLKQISSDEKVLAKDENLRFTHSKTSSVSQKKICNQKNTGKENIEQNLNNNHDVSLSQQSEKPKFSSENVAIAPRKVSKKMEKYRSTLKNYKNKVKTEADTKEEQNVQQYDNASQNENLRLQEPLQHQILKEIQRHKLHLNLRQFV